MKVFIIGVTGQTGSRLARNLINRGCDVAGLYRRCEQKAILHEFGVKGFIGDLTVISFYELAEALREHDVLVFTAGAGDAESDAMTDRVDGGGVTKAIAAAKIGGIKRFVLVSVFPEALRGKHMSESFEHYMAVKKRTEIELVAANIEWVIIRPSSLVNRPGTGLVSLSNAERHTEITRDDVAATIGELIYTPSIRNKILELTEGNTLIAKAVADQGH